MTKKLLFVHGTGVRRAGYDESIAKIRRRLEQSGHGIELVECFWGETHGAEADVSRSIPRYGATGGRNVVADDEFRWTVLLYDPTVEMHQLALSKRTPLGNSQDGREGIRLRHLSLPAQALPSFVEDGLDQLLAGAVDSVQADYSRLLRGDSNALAPGDLATVLARATVARVLRLADGHDRPAPTLERRNELIEAVNAHLVEGNRGAMAGALSLAARLAGPLLAGYRGKLTDMVRDAFGDILRYQARGAALRRLIADQLAAVPNDQVVILAHSLGGIASLETLVEHRPGNVAALITFGSQAPLLYELGALATLPNGKLLPATMPYWLNFYDLDDPLSYVANPVFPGQVSDYQVNSGSDFLGAHSAYLDSDQMWTQIFAYLK
ncbi:hypothetical protein [Pseudoduganella armeniaca]|uniref:hypothetical protein n=1 Tax=Pseudoduganella armeniaca TaxID=2072590 RepID=UPI0015E723DC|nr:hypothetical protein [Pseudoduganella armeniaca]